MTETSGTLKGINLLDGLDDQTIEDLSRQCSFRDHARGEILIRKGDTNNDVYFVIAGQVAVFNYMDNAAQVFLTEFFPGDIFGEMAAIDGGIRSAWVVAADPSTVATLPGDVFIETVTTVPAIAMNGMKHLTRVIRGAGSRVRNLSLLNGRQRIISEIIRIAGATELVSGEALINKMPSHSALASFSSTSRELVAETIGELMRNNIISRRGHSIIINEITQIRHLIDQEEYGKMDSEDGVASLFKEIYM